MKSQSEVERIARRYRKHGVSLDKLLELLVSAKVKGLPYDGAIAWLRLALDNEFGEEEYFSAEQSAAITGETSEQAKTRMLEYCCTHADHGPVITIDRRALAIMETEQEE